MSSAFNHFVDMSERGQVEVLDERRMAESPEWGRWHLCKSRGCDKLPTHFTGYYYITGRGGRVSWSGRCYCTEHMIKFAKKHKAKFLHGRVA